MGSRTTYTSTITVPVYASWKCEKCSEVNITTGAIVCKREESSSSWSSSKQHEAEMKASQRARDEWVEEAFKIITDPNHNASLMLSGFYLQNTNCTNCGKKPRWNKNVRFLWTIPLLFIWALFSIIAVISEVTSIAAWLSLISVFGIFALLISREEVYKRMMPNLPKQYTPVIGTRNEELIEYANIRGKKIPTPDECVEIVKGYTDIAKNLNVPPIDNGEEKSYFCRKCGTKLMEDSEFCHQCGTEVRKQ